MNLRCGEQIKDSNHYVLEARGRKKMFLYLVHLIQMKNKKKYHLPATLFLLFFTFSLCSQQSTKQNIIVFIADDMGWTDMSVVLNSSATQMNKRYHTPHLEKLAQDGIKYTRAYAQPVCTPSRVSLMTGMNVINHKVSNWILDKDKITDANDSIWISDKWNMNGLSPVANIPNTIYATPLPAILKQHGYHTIHVGKAHLGARNTPGEDPNTLGFDINIAGHAAGGLGSHLSIKRFGNKEGESHTLPWGVPGLEKYYDQDITVTQALTSEAIFSLDHVLENKHQPFFLYLSHYNVHIPIEPDKRYYQKYIQSGLTATEAAYASMVEGMDQSMGDIIEYLKKNNIYDQTSILFLSDNGGYSWPVNYNNGKSFTTNAPLRAGKGSVHEGGIRIPLIIKSKDIKSIAKTNDRPIIVEDLFPTILDLARITNYKIIQHIDGHSVLKKYKPKPFIFHYPHKWVPEKLDGVNYSSSIINGKWKLVWDIASGKKDLYDINADQSESNDLSITNKKMTDQMYTLLKNNLDKSGAPMPYKKAQN